ncbi:hypothetical protein ACMFMG_009249 [Clarireedia jacksonii]
MPRAKHEEASAKPSYESKSKEELIAILKERLMPATGTKEILIRRLQDNEDYSPSTAPKEPSRRVLDRNPESSAAHESKADEMPTPAPERDRPMQTPSSKSSCPSNNGVTAKKEDDILTYATKDNSKLVRLLHDRGLSTAGSREEMIHRLETSTYDYGTRSAEELSLMLSERHFVNASLGNKTLKIERLKLDDQGDCDRGNYKEIIMYVHLDMKETTIKELEEAISNAGLDAATRLESNDRNSKRLPPSQIRKSIDETREKLNNFKKQYNEEKAELEAIVGHPVEPKKVSKQIDELDARDRLLQDSYQPARKSQPMCDYDWKKSHWAKRSGRELQNMCQRQGMQGSGNKATCIKWLETGEVDYGDLSMTSLEFMCGDRDIKVRSKERKLDLVKKLRDADEAEAKLSEKERKDLIKARRPKSRMLRELA